MSKFDPSIFIARSDTPQLVRFEYELEHVALLSLLNYSIRAMRRQSVMQWCWETLASRRKLSRICALFKAYSGKRAWKVIGDRIQRPHYLSRADHDWKICSSMQKTDIGKYSSVNRTIHHWNQLPAEVLGTLPCKPTTFKKRVRKAIIEVS